MVADTGEEFYAEVPYPDEKCTPLVRLAVLPQLGRNPDFSCSVADLGIKLRQWLELVRRDDETVYLCFDYTTDWDLFLDVIQFRIAPWIEGKLINSEIDEILLEEFYKDTGLSRHHALNDALANKFAYRPLIAKKQIEIRRIKKVGKNWREKLPKQFIKNTLRAIRELRAGMTTTYIFGRIDKKQVLKRTSRRTRQPGLLKGRITIAADFDAPLIISAHTENKPDADDDSDWVRNPITQELLDVLNDRTIPPHDMPKDTVINEDPMIYSDYFDAPLAVGSEADFNRNMMTVGSLINSLLKLPKSLPVLVQGYETGWDAGKSIDVCEMVNNAETEEWDGEFDVARENNKSFTAALIKGPRIR